MPSFSQKPIFYKPLYRGNETRTTSKARQTKQPSETSFKTIEIAKGLDTFKFLIIILAVSHCLPQAEARPINLRYKSPDLIKMLFDEELSKEIKNFDDVIKVVAKDILRYAPATLEKTPRTYQTHNTGQCEKFEGAFFSNSPKLELAQSAKQEDSVTCS